MTPTMIADQPFFTQPEAAAALGIPVRTLRQEMKRRRISFQRRPYKRANICFQRSDLLAYLKKTTVPARS